METRIADQTTTYRYAILVGHMRQTMNGTADQYRQDRNRIRFVWGRDAVLTGLFTVDGGYRVTLPEDSERIIRDAYGIAYVGACNATAVRNTIEGWLRQGVPADSLPIRCMMGQADFLAGRSLGPSFEDLTAIMDAYAAL